MSEGGTPVSRQRAGRAILWSGVGWYSTYLLTFGFSLVTARLLTPAEFGLVGLVYIIVSVAQMLADSGTMAALVQREGQMNLATSTGLVSVGANALVGSALIAAASPLVASFYDQPRLGWICFAMAWLVFVYALSIPAEALLQRHLDLKARKAVVDPLSTIGYGVTVIVCALAGLGPWALVIAQYVSFGVVTAGCWILARKYYSWERPTFAMYRSLVRFGRGLLTANISEAVEEQAAPTVLGRQLGESAVGLWGAGRRLGQIPLAGTVSILGGVVFSALSRLASDANKFRAVAVESLTMNALLVVPFGAAFFVLGTPIMTVLYGSRWSGAGVVLQWMGLWAISMGMASTGREIFKALGRPMLVARGALIEVLVAVGYLGVLWATDHVTLWAVALGRAFSSGALVLSYAVQGHRIKALDFASQWRAVRSPIMAGIVQAVCVAAAFHLLVPDFTQWRSIGGVGLGVLPSLLMLGVLFVGGIGVYTATLRLLDPTSLRDFAANVRNSVRSRAG